MKLNVRDLKEDTIESLVITWDLYNRILKYTKDNDFETSYYDHGHGVRRTYTLNYCLQYNDHENRPKKYILKRKGRAPSKYTGPSGNREKWIETIKADTPSYDSLCRNIARKCPGDVLFVNRKSESEREVPNSDEQFDPDNGIPY